MENTKKKGTIVAITGNIYPYFSPCSKIIFNVLEELADKYEIVIIAQKSDFLSDIRIKKNNFEVIQVLNYNVFLSQYIHNKIKRSRSEFEKGALRVLEKTRKYCYFVYRTLCLNSLDPIYVIKLYIILKKIAKTVKIDAIIPVSSPHESIQAAIMYKKRINKNIQVLSYQLDHFSDNKTMYAHPMFVKFKYRRNIIHEIDVLKFCNRHFVLPTILKHFKKRCFERYFNKIVVTEIPLLKKTLVSGFKPLCNDRPVISYVGMLDLMYRNPTCLFQILLDMNKNFAYEFHLCSFGNCDRIIDYYVKRIGKNFVNHGFVSRIFIEKILIKSDVLITIGNQDLKGIPSKLFEYLSYGKPIVHFYFSEKDPYLKYLNDYKHSLCINASKNNAKSSSMAFTEFCRYHCNKREKFETIEKIYFRSTPKYVANQFYNYLIKQ